jgi:hypothetical protein
MDHHLPDAGGLAAHGRPSGRSGVSGSWREVWLCY